MSWTAGRQKQSDPDTFNIWLILLSWVVRPETREPGSYRLFTWAAKTQRVLQLSPSQSLCFVSRHCVKVTRSWEIIEPPLSGNQLGRQPECKTQHSAVQSYIVLCSIYWTDQIWGINGDIWPNDALRPPEAAPAIQWNLSISALDRQPPSSLLPPQYPNHRL